jgi:hypothetical protein
MNANKTFWQKFNPSLKEMMERHPDYSVLGLWWSFTWRIWIVAAVIWAVFAILIGIFGAVLHR